MTSFTNRMIRAAKLDVNLYEEVEADKGAMGQAMGVVILSSVAAGIGTIGTTGIIHIQNITAIYPTPEKLHIPSANPKIFARLKRFNLAVNIHLPRNVDWSGETYNHREL